ncbi:unnamed protein product [Caenorhabditis auriculariae]|uniref:Uncharacterized protein n=1 Tax=Caenorhabditis auriculariae TaxID=2777116 RepID=A0A8S1HX36_9PELO|nr:unnamed protein product [Caenorhabditis auriculariae]
MHLHLPHLSSGWTDSHGRTHINDGDMANMYSDFHKALGETYWQTASNQKICEDAMQALRKTHISKKTATFLKNFVALTRDAYSHAHYNVNELFYEQRTIVRSEYWHEIAKIYHVVMLKADKVMHHDNTLLKLELIMHFVNLYSMYKDIADEDFVVDAHSRASTIYAAIHQTPNVTDQERSKAQEYSEAVELAYRLRHEHARYANDETRRVGEVPSIDLSETIENMSCGEQKDHDNDDDQEMRRMLTENLKLRHVVQQIHQHIDDRYKQLIDQDEPNHAKTPLKSQFAEPDSQDEEHDSDSSDADTVIAMAVRPTLMAGLMAESVTRSRPLRVSMSPDAVNTFEPAAEPNEPNAFLDLHQVELKPLQELDSRMTSVPEFPAHHPQLNQPLIDLDSEPAFVEPSPVFVEIDGLLSLNGSQPPESLFEEPPILQVLQKETEMEEIALQVDWWSQVRTRPSAENLLEQEEPFLNVPSEKSSDIVLERAQEMQEMKINLSNIENTHEALDAQQEMKDWNKTLDDVTRKSERARKLSNKLWQSISNNYQNAATSTSSTIQTRKSRDFISETTEVSCSRACSTSGLANEQVPPLQKETKTKEKVAEEFQDGSISAECTTSTTETRENHQEKVTRVSDHSTSRSGKVRERREINIDEEIARRMSLQFPPSPESSKSSLNVYCTLPRRSVQQAPQAEDRLTNSTVLEPFDPKSEFERRFPRAKKSIKSIFNFKLPVISKTSERRPRRIAAHEMQIDESLSKSVTVFEEMDLETSKERGSQIPASQVSTLSIVAPRKPPRSMIEDRITNIEEKYTVVEASIITEN